MKKALKPHIPTLLNVWPLFLGARIRVKRFQSDWSEIDVEMKLRFWNSNYVGTHYGGSLCSMAEPFNMLMLIENFGPRLHREGQVRHHSFQEARNGSRFCGIPTLRRANRGNTGSTEDRRERRENRPSFALEIKDESGAVVAEVQKQLHIRRKSPGSHQERLASGTRSPSRGASSTPARSK